MSYEINEFKLHGNTWIGTNYKIVLNRAEPHTPFQVRRTRDDALKESCKTLQKAFNKAIALEEIHPNAVKEDKVITANIYLYKFLKTEHTCRSIITASGVKTFIHFPTINVHVDFIDTDLKSNTMTIKIKDSDWQTLTDYIYSFK